MSSNPRTVRPWIKRELATYRAGLDAFEGLREPTKRDIEQAQHELKLERLDGEIAVMRRLVHAERTERLQRLGLDVTSYRPLRDTPAPRGRGPIMEGRIVRPGSGVVLGVR